MAHYKGLRPLLWAMGHESEDEGKNGVFLMFPQFNLEVCLQIK